MRHTTSWLLLGSLALAGAVTFAVYPTLAGFSSSPFGGSGESGVSDDGDDSAITFTSTQSDGGAAFIMPTGQRLCLNGEPCTVFVQYDGGALGLAGSEVDVPNGFTDSQKVNSSTSITPYSVNAQAASGERALGVATDGARIYFGAGGNTYCFLNGSSEIECASSWQVPSIETNIIGPATPGRNKIDLFYPRPFPLGSLDTCDSDHQGVITTLSGDGRTYQCNGTSNQTFGFRQAWSGALDFGAISAGDCADLTFTATGAVRGEAVACGGLDDLAAADSNLIGFCSVTATNTVTVRACCERLMIACANPSSTTFSAAALR